MNTWTKTIAAVATCCAFAVASPAFAAQDCPGHDKTAKKKKKEDKNEGDAFAPVATDCPGSDKTAKKKKKEDKNEGDA